MSSIALEVGGALAAKPPKRCPIRRKAPKGARLHEVQPRLRALLCLYARLCQGIERRKRGMESLWQTERANAVEFMLTDSIRTMGRHGSVNIEFYSDWQYTTARVHAS